MGALDQGIITPTFSSIAEGFGIEYNLAVWGLTIYTLSYAVSIPIMGKLADRYGRKRLFMVGVGLFGLGSFVAGTTGNFYLFLAARAIQAIGGGGIFPIANAQVAATFPPEKRGVALGMVGAIFGIASLIGPNLGGLIIDFFDWQWVFLINVPISIILILMSLKIEETREAVQRPLDLGGVLVVSIAIFCLMYGITHLDRNDLVGSLLGINVWGYFVAVLLLIPILIFVEKRAQDPILNLQYFTQRNTLVTLLVGLSTGLLMSVMFFVPLFAETVVGVDKGTAGYLMTPLALASGIGAPVGGALLHKRGPKLVMLSGFLVVGLSSLGMAYAVSGVVSFIIVTFVMGFGFGLVIGAPLNEMMFRNVDKHESASALASLSLFRSIGTSLGPTLAGAMLAGVGPEIGRRLSTLMPSGMTGTAMSGGNMNFDAGALEEMTASIPEPARSEVLGQIEALVHEVFHASFTDLYILGIVFALLGTLLILFYRDKKSTQQ